MFARFTRPRSPSPDSPSSPSTSATSISTASISLAHLEKHRRRFRHVALANGILLVVAFVLLLLVAISLPIVKGVYLLRFVAVQDADAPPTSVATELRFGVWGFCATSALNMPTLLTNNGLCTSPRLGYDVDEDILAVTGQPQLIEALLRGLILVLVLHPISAALTLVTLILSCLTFWHMPAILALISAIIAALLTTVSAVIDIAIVAIARGRVGDLTQFSFEVGYGNAPWMSVFGTIFLWVAIVLLSAMNCACCGIRYRPWHRRKQRSTSEEALREMEETRPQALQHGT